MFFFMFLVFCFFLAGLFVSFFFSLSLVSQDQEEMSAATMGKPTEIRIRPVGGYSQLINY